MCDVPFLGKKWVHQVAEYDIERGVSTWRASFQPGPDDGRVTSQYFDPIHLLPQEGQRWWEKEERVSFSAPDHA